jgi:Spy/CpxP family protein refolding chaperone
MRKFAFIAIIAIAGGWMIAGAAGAAADKPASRPARMKVLNLSDEQKAAIREIVKSAREQAAKLDTREQRVAVLKGAWAKVRAEVLNDEQRVKLDQLRAKLRGARERMAKSGMLDKLGLTDQQKAAAREIITKAHEQARGAQTLDEKLRIMRDAFAKFRSDVLTDEQRQTADELRAQGKERFEQFRQKMRERMQQRFKEHAARTQPAA